jgi:hypothetical protein
MRGPAPSVSTVPPVLPGQRVRGVPGSFSGESRLFALLWTLGIALWLPKVIRPAATHILHHARLQNRLQEGPLPAQKDAPILRRECQVAGARRAVEQRRLRQLRQWGMGEEGGRALPSGGQHPGAQTFRDKGQVAAGEDSRRKLMAGCSHAAPVFKRIRGGGSPAAYPFSLVPPTGGAGGSARHQTQTAARTGGCL